MIRLFAAIPVPGEIGEVLLTRQHGVQQARWRPLEALHITLRFFGEVAENRAEDIDSALSQVAGAPFDLSLGGVGAFGEGADIHALWAGVEPSAALDQLARRCEAAARRAGARPETRVFKPHVTLAYLRRPEPAAVAAWIQSNNLLRSPPFRVAAFGLYSSWGSDAGSTYQLERQYRL